MRTISATEFKAHCLQVMDEVRKTRAPVTVTKRGKPVVKVLPAGEPDDIFGRLRGVMEIVGDIEAPAAPAEDWNALK
ncbi:MAG TPA: type II toxin-antitoxin system Phd/YefM family antitoxin [Terriglobales bacterium]|nr:type II toxin-antitoxin system Phd/YefM family antitoxin [Terriglobales bacterium]